MKRHEDFNVKTRRQLANEFGMHVNTLMRKLKREGVELPKGLVCPKEQRRIYELFGNPEHIQFKNNTI